MTDGSITVWGRTTSGNVQKVLWLCDELAIPVHRIDAGGRFGVNDTPEYRAMNPMGLVPTAKDGDVVLWESNAILRYLADTRGGERLYPRDPVRRSLVERWLDWGLGTLGGAMQPLFWQLIRTPEAERDPARIAALTAQAARLWGILDGALEGHEFVAGDGPTLADLSLAPWLHRWMHLPLDRPDLPNLEAWHARLSGRPGYQRWVAIPLS